MLVSSTDISIFFKKNYNLIHRIPELQENLPN